VVPPGEIHVSPGGTLRGSLRDTFCARAAHVISPKERNGKKGRIVVVTVPKFPGSRGSPFTSGSFQRDDPLGVKDGLRADLECDPEDGAAVDGR
jgi:hypothetical protein